MSLFDWRVAKRQVQSGYNFGYDAAIEHYANLKRKMFDQIAVNQSLINGNYYEEVEKLLQQELSELYDGTSQRLSSLSYKSLSTIQQMVKDVFDGTDSGILTSFANELNNLENNKNMKQHERRQEIERIRQNILNYFGKENIQKIAQEALNNYSGNSGDFGVIYSFLYSFLINTIKWYTSSNTQQLFINKNALTTLMGYYKEIIEVKLLQELFAKMKSQSVTKQQINVDLIAGKNTINDIIFSFLTPFKAQQVAVAENISAVGEAYEQQLGAQIKTRDIQNVKTEFMKISHQSELSKQFNLNMISSAGRFSKYSWSCGVAFLGQTENILQSLGINNVMFISGATRDFTDNFIRNFRSKNMYLAFEFDAQHKATSQVGLQRYVENRGKNQILARFR